MSDRLSRCFRQVILAQLFILGLCFLLALVFYNRHDGLAVVLGGALAVINTIVSRRSILRASQSAYQQPDMGLLPVFSGLIQRLIVFAAGFSGGVLLLNLTPLPILIAFGLAQLGYFACKMQ